MRRSILAVAVVAGIASSLFVGSLRPQAFAHCEVPCGIYDDHARVVQMLEDTTTIGKATDQIIVLSEVPDPQSINQLGRWISTKEEHATRIQHTIAQYFLTQRVKPKAPGSAEWDDYAKRLAEHHAVMVAAMKTKQTVDPNAVEGLRETIMVIGKYYPAPEHSHDHG